MAASTDYLTIRLQMLGGGQVRAEAVSTAGAVTAMGDATEVAGKKSAFAAEKTFLFGEEMYSLRRYAFYGITALGVTAGAVIKLGYDFVKTRDESVGALTAITGGLSNAKTEVNALIGLTHDTGLGLDVLTTAAKNMILFKYSVRDTNAYLKDFGNYAQAKGLGGAGLTSIVSVFDRIKDTGRVDSRTLTALRNLGVPGSALESALGLTPTQLVELQRGQGFVSATAATPALAGWMGQFAASQPKTLGQQVGIAKSYLAPLLGEFTQPFFDWLDQTALPGLTKRLRTAVLGLQSGGIAGMFTALDPSGTLTNAWRLLTIAVEATGNVLRSFFRVVKDMSPLFVIAGGVLGVLAHHTTLVKGAIYGLTGAYVLNRIALIAVMGYEKLAWAAWVIYYGTIVGVTTATKALTLWNVNARLGLAELTTSIGIAEGASSVLLATMTALAGLGIIALGVEIVIHRAAVDKAVGDFLDAHGLGFLGGTKESAMSSSQLVGPGQQQTLADTFGVKQVAKLDLAAHLAASQIRQSGADPALVAAIIKAMSQITVKSEVHVDGKKLAETNSKARAARLATIK